MQDPDWDRIHEIHDRARRLARADRNAYVEKASDGDPNIVGAVLDLLALDDESFMEPPLNLPLASLADDLLGNTINGRYFIEKELGSGGMSHVYLARDRRVDDRAVVIKFLTQDLVGNPFARQKFRQESEALSRIHHVNVVQVLDQGELPDGRPYLVMEFVDGEMLRSQIRSEGMNVERAATILKQIGSALDQAHQHGIIHRDLKPENVLLRHSTGDVVLIDFGIAKVTDSILGSTTINGQTAGTLPYMSPEQLRGERVSAASDIYSMAVIAYEMLTGRRPFNTTSPARLVELQKNGVKLKPRRLREDLPPEAEAIILRALSFDPSARYQNAREFGDSLADALTPAANAPQKRIQFNVSRVPLWILLGAALLVLGYQVINWQPKREPNRSFNYFVTVQRVRGEQLYQTPYKSHGEETYANGDKFRLTVSTPVPAYLYVLKEGGMQIKMISPRQATKGASSLGADESFESEWMTFSDQPGTESFWIVWSTSPVAELEAVIGEAFNNSDGVLTGQTLVTVKQFLIAKKAESEATTYNYNANQTAVVRAKRDLIVVLAQFKHR